MLEISTRRSILLVTTLEATTGTIIKGMTMIEETKEEEEMLQETMTKIVDLKRSQDFLGMKVMLQINMNIFLFLPLLVLLLRICGVVGWLIVGLLIISLDIRKFSLI